MPCDLLHSIFVIADLYLLYISESVPYSWLYRRKVYSRKEPIMDHALLVRRPLLLLCCSLLLLFVSCAPTTITPAASKGATTTTASPIVSTSCPPTATARPAIMLPFSIALHASVVYVDNRLTPDYLPSSGTLKRYDTVTGKTSAIVALSNENISDAQISADGQWILFVAQVNYGLYRTQLIRLDGAYLQTLYCSSQSDSLFQWSPDKQLVIFQDGIVRSALHLLNLTTGAIQTVFTSSSNRQYSATGWLNNTQVYLWYENSAVVPFSTSLYLLDTTHGASQHASDLHPVIQSQASTWSFANSPDSAQLFFNQCAIGPEKASPPCRIGALPAAGGSPRTIFSSNNIIVNGVQAISNTSLLVLCTSNAPYNSDTGKSGLWTIHSDGSGMTQLFSPASVAIESDSLYLNLYSQTSWANTSRNGQFYAASAFTAPNQYVILLGLISGGKPSIIATLPESGYSEEGIVGWTS